MSRCFPHSPARDLLRATQYVRSDYLCSQPAINVDPQQAMTQTSQCHLYLINIVYNEIYYFHYFII